MKYGLPKRMFMIAVSCILAMPGGVTVLAAEELENNAAVAEAGGETAGQEIVPRISENDVIAYVGYDEGAAESGIWENRAATDNASIETAEQGTASGILENISVNCTGYSPAEEYYTISLGKSEDGADQVTVTIEKSALDDKVLGEYYLAQVRYQCIDGEEQPAEKKTETAEQCTYTFELSDIEEDVFVTADFIPVVWDGTVDLTWYDEESAEFDIYYPAQLAGAAALCNGIFNNYPMKDDENGNMLPDVTAQGQPAAAKGYYNTYGSETNKTAVVGDISMLTAKCGADSPGNNSDSTTDFYWYGGEDFAGKTLYLMADLDMGGRKSDSASPSSIYTTAAYGWDPGSALYMPIGGQYCMNPADGYTKLSASFNGTLNGQGYTVKNIYCDRWSAKYGDAQSIGLVGRLGCHDNDPKTAYASPSVRNVAVDGIFYGQRSVGGIVGKNGKSNGSLIENCLNFATVLHTGAKGGGGIAGAGWNKLTVKNCANFGYIGLEFQGGSEDTGGGNAGGLIGSSEATAINCYSVGYVYSKVSGRAQSLGTNNGGAVWRNCFYLAQSSSSGAGVFNSIPADTIEEIRTPGEFVGNPEFVEKINGTGRAWISQTADQIKSDGLKAALKSGFAGQTQMDQTDMTETAIPRVFTGDDSEVVEITTTGQARLSGYVEGQTFDLGTWEMKASYDDGTHEIVEISDAYISYQNGDYFSLGDTAVTVTVPMAFADACTFPAGDQMSVSLEGNNCIITFSVDEVFPNEVSFIKITKAPAQAYYIVGEAFNPEGMEVTAYYTNGQEQILSLRSDESGIGDDDYSCGYAVEGGSLTSLQMSDTEVIVTYTFRDKTVSAGQNITVVELTPPEINDRVAQVRDASDFLWFAYMMKNDMQYDVVLLDDIDLTNTGFVPVGLEHSTDSKPKAYTGTFDGNGKTITLDYHGDGQYNALFAFSEKGAVIKNLTVCGSVEAAAGSSYTAGIVAFSNGGTITGCTNQASLTGTTDCIGGIAAYVSAADDTVILNCANEGNVSAENGSSIGGIVGTANLVQVDSCYNIGRIQQGYRVGGIAGRILKSDAKIQNCYNRGDVTATEGGYAGGIAGICQVATSMTLKNCYNTGAVEGASACKGAVMGYSYLTRLTAVQGNYSTDCGGCELIGGTEEPSAFTQVNVQYIDKAGLDALTDTKASTTGLGEAYRKDLKPINDGYPILAWQMSEDEYERLVKGQQQTDETPAPEQSPQPQQTLKPQQTPEPEQTPKPKQIPEQTPIPKKGASLKSGKATYKVTKAGTKNGTVEYSKISGNPKTVTIAAVVTINGITYQVTSIAKNAFKGNKKLTTVKIGNNVKTIAASTFSGCTKLQKVTVGKGVTEIGANAFYNCKALKTVTIGAQTAKIGGKAFANCTKLTKITIPAKVKSIGKQAFYGCQNLKNITIKTTKLTKKNVGSKAFASINKKAVIKVPKKKVKTYRALLKAKGIGSKVKIK